MTKRFYELKDDAIELFRERVKEEDIVNDEDLNDLIYEVAELSLPAYNHEILEIAINNLIFAFVVPEI